MILDNKGKMFEDRRKENKPVKAGRRAEDKLAKKEETKKNKGITLIALVITIIVMLILVGVTINLAVNGGLFNYAGRASSQTEEEKKQEQLLGAGIVGEKTIEDWVTGGESLLPNSIIPAGGIYVRTSDMSAYYSEVTQEEKTNFANALSNVGYSGTTLDDLTKAGEKAPQGLNYKDVYFYGDYLYEYESAGSYPGWGCICVYDKTKTSYNSLLNSINGEKITFVLAFKNCDNLTQVPKFPNSVVNLGDSIFDGCTSLTSVIIPNGVIELGDCICLGCTNLTSITIPNSVTGIAHSAFSGCTKLTSITYSGTKNDWMNINLANGWNDNSAIDTIHCTDGDIIL